MRVIGKRDDISQRAENPRKSVGLKRGAEVKTLEPGLDANMFHTCAYDIKNTACYGIILWNADRIV